MLGREGNYESTSPYPLVQRTVSQSTCIDVFEDERGIVNRTVHEKLLRHIRFVRVSSRSFRAKEVWSEDQTITA